MITIPVALDCPLPPERVLHAAHDFSRRRVQIWPAVREQHLAVHQLGETSADVTEGTPAGIGINWERCRYDWSEAGRVSATVTDSNVYAQPGSSWQITATPAGGGSHVVMTWNRKFRRTPRGLIFGTLFAIVGRPIFRSYARETLANLLTVEGAAG
jgi:Polyketide cyclase / dehydrase and lipid transport